MKDIKLKVLGSSAVLVVLATLIGVFNSLHTSGAETGIRLGMLSIVLGLGSIGLFFIGLALPKE